MKQLSCLDRQKFGKSVSESILAIRIKQVLHPFVMMLARTAITCTVEITNQYDPIPDKPIIFAVNHSAFYDTPIALRSVKQHCYILAGKQKLSFVNWMFFMLNGTIWVDRGNKRDMTASKDGIISYLRKGVPIIWFPEGTWNLTSNLLMLPLRWGIIDVVQQANAQIIPMILDYNWENNICKVKFGSPLVYSPSSAKSDSIRNLRDTMATLRWDFLHQSVKIHRATVSAKELENMMTEGKNYLSDENLVKEYSYIYRPHPSPSEVFSHLNDLIPCKENAFLFRKR